MNERVIRSDTVAQVNGESISTTIPGEAVILDVDSGRYFGLEGVGARVWEMLQEPVAVGEIVEVLLGEYEVSPELCQRDVMTLLEQLRDANLVRLHAGTST